jgi:hypothetical protein
VIIGTGIHPDSSSAYNSRTTFIGWGALRLLNNAGGEPSSAEIHGVTFGDGVWASIGDGDVPGTVMNGVKFIRCDFWCLALGYGVDASAATGTIVRGCIVRDQLYVNRAVNSTIQNSFIHWLYYGGQGTTVVNCVFMDFDQVGDNGNANVVYRSNIFLRAIGTNYAITEASTFQNNLYVVQGASQVSWPNALVQANNQQTTVMANVFVNNTSFNDFAYDRNYHIVSGPYQTMAFDGGEVGVYGTNGQPLKDGFVPFNPHLINLSAQGSTSGGTLQNVNIKGSAQTH